MSTHIADTESGVEVTRRIVSTERWTTMTYQIERTEKRPARVRLVERLPESVERSTVVFPGEDDPGRWQYLGSDKLACEVVLSGTGTVETAAMITETLDDDLDPTVTVTELPETDGNDGTRIISDGRGVTSHTVDQRTAPMETPAGPKSEDGPAFGIITTADEGEAVGRLTLRAVERNMPVFVVATDGPQSVKARVARRLGATVVNPGVEDPDHDDCRTALAVAALNRSCPGVIVREEGTEPVDFEASLTAFEEADRTIVEAVPERHPQVTETVAGIPAYNEAETIGSVVEAAREFVDEVLVVDDGSDDETAARARDAGATVIAHERNRGYGAALKRLFERADSRETEHLVVLDADDQHDAGDIPRLIEEQRDSGAEIVIGSRFDENARTNAPRYRRVGLKAITFLVNLSMGAVRRENRISDAQSGFRAYDRAAIASLAANVDSFDERMGVSYDILHHAHEEGFDVTEVPTTITYDVSNANTHNPIRHALNVVNTVVETVERKHPIAVLGFPGFLVALLGIGLWYATLTTSAHTGQSNLLLGVLGGVLVLVGVLSSVTSMLHRTLRIHLNET